MILNRKLNIFDIKKIDNDDNLYRSILKENLLIKFFRNIFRQEKSKVKRIDEFNINTNICTNL